MMMRRRHDDETGAGMIVELIGGIILLVPVAVAIASMPTWAERQSLGRLAAQEAARTAAVADSWPAAASRAAQVADELAANHGINPTDLTVSLDGNLERHGTVTATATITIPALTMPLLATTPQVDWSYTHTEQADHYRTRPPD